jgi:hypothetical protein
MLQGTNHHLLGVIRMNVGAEVRSQIQLILP